jgi:hypothetical protein
MYGRYPNYDVLEEAPHWDEVTRRLVMPTQGSANPALTVMALSSRLAERLNQKRVRMSRRADSGRRLRVRFPRKAGRVRV